MAKNKETIQLGSVTFTISEAKKMKKDDLKKWEKFINIPLEVAWQRIQALK